MRTSYIKTSGPEPPTVKLKEREAQNEWASSQDPKKFLTSHYLDYPTYNFPIFGIIDF